MTRRDFIWIAAAPARRLTVPIHRVMDVRTKCPPETLRNFWSNIWPEAVRTFGQGGIDLQTTDAQGEIRLSPGDRPIFVGLRRAVTNLVVTDHIPMLWDKARSLAGVTTLYEGYPVCLVALRYAHGHQIPFLSVNTCVHELLHALLQDIFVSRPTWYQSGGREVRIDSYATGLWLFHDGAAIRKSAERYLERLRADAALGYSERKGAAGRPAELYRLPLGKLAQE